MTDPRSTLLGMTEAKAAEILGLHPDTLRKYRRNGQIGHLCLPGGQIRYQPEHLHKFVAATRVEPRSGILGR